MYPIFVLFISLMVFTGLQASYWWITSRRERREQRLIDRLGRQEGEDELLRKKVEGNIEGYLVNLLRAAGEDDDIKAFTSQISLYGIVGFFFGLLMLGGLAAAVFCACGGVLFLYFRLVQKRDQRVLKIEEQLPEALELMIISLRAGQSLEQTLILNAKEIEGALGEEFQRIVEEMKLGRPLDDALRAFGERMKGAKTIRTFVVSVLVLRQTGGNLIEVLEAIIDTMRQQSQYESKLRSMTAEGRSNARTLGALPPVFVTLAYIASPDYMSQIVDHPVGRGMGIMSLTLYCIGFLWVRRLVRPQH